VFRTVRRSDKSQEEPVHHTIGHWQNYGYSFFYSSTVLIFGMFSEYDTDSTKNFEHIHRQNKSKQSKIWSYFLKK